MKWFKHDSDASLDAKLIKLRIKHGMEGYGLYWYCLEQIARNIDRHNLTFELEHDSEVISHDTGIHFERVQEMMQDMVKLNLFESNNGMITCIKMAIRLDDTTSRHPEIKRLQNSFRRLSEDSPKTFRTEQNRTEQKRIEKKKKDPQKFTPPSVKEVEEFCRERGNDVDPVKFVNHYEAIGWMRGKNKIKNWKACVITWEKNTAESKYGQGGI